MRNNTIWELFVLNIFKTMNLYRVSETLTVK